MNKDIRELESELEKAAHHLLSVWTTYSYGGTWASSDGYVYHACMSVGEDAVDWLEKYGYVESHGNGATITEKGKALMDREDLAE